MRTARAWGLLLGVAADAVLGDPRRGHPVAGFGRAAGSWERAVWRDTRGAGVAYALPLVLVPAAAGALAERGTRVRGPLRQVAVTAVATWAVVGGTSLGREGRALHRALASGDVAAARVRLPHLCGRDPSGLDAAGLARAGVESVAENTSDAVVAPLLWGAVAGVPGLLAYRAVNTLDAMVGHRSPRYARFGWAAARVDDVANLVPARVTALLAAGLAPLVGGRPGSALAVARRDGGRHPSPNAGPVEAAFAGALGRRLGGPLVYAGSGPELRPSLGDGPAPDVDDLLRAVRLSRAVGAAAGLLAAAVAAGLAVRSDRGARPAAGGGWSDRGVPAYARVGLTRGPGPGAGGGWSDRGVPAYAPLGLTGGSDT